MPIFPEPKIPSVAQILPPFIYENHMTDIFIPNTKSSQKLPIFTINQPLTNLDSIDDLLFIQSPSDGTFTEFKIFIVSNTTGDTFRIALSHGIFESLFLEDIVGTANTLYTTTTSINVNKGDNLRYNFVSSTGVPTVGKVVSAYITFVFVPTAS